MTGLSQFRADAEPEETTFEQSVALIEPFAPRWHNERIMCVDPSIASTGWVMLALDAKAASVLGAGTIKTSTMAKGHEDSLQRVQLLDEHLDQLMVDYDPTLLAFELPPVATAYGRNNRPDSALSAAVTLRLAWNRAWPEGRLVRGVSAQATKKRWTGSAKSDKPTLKAYLTAIFPDLIGQLAANNEHTRDALGLGLVAAEGTFHAG